MGSIKDVNSKNIRIELEKVKGILERQGMKVFFVDTTDKALRIPSVFVYIRGAKYFDPDISDRNVSLALIEESFAMRDYARVETLIARGKKAGYIRKGVAEYYKGAVLMLKKRYRKAIPYLRYASRHCAVREHKKFALVKLGIAYQATGNVDRALDHYIMMVHRYPDFRMDFTSPFKRGASVRKAKRVSLTDSVRDLYDDVRAARIEVRNCPTSRFKKIFKDYRKRKRTVQAGIRRSHGDFKAGEYRRAVKTVEKMRRKNSLVDIMHNVSLMAGYCYERMGEYGKAVEALQKATRLNPEAAQIYFTISRCYRNTGQNDKAEKAFTAGIRAIEKYKKQDFVEREHALVKGA
jgi:tetratricopeptide (TPR) repeat protein